MCLHARACVRDLPGVSRSESGQAAANNANANRTAAHCVETGSETVANLYLPTTGHVSSSTHSKPVGPFTISHGGPLNNVDHSLLTQLSSEYLLKSRET